MSNSFKCDFFCRLGIGVTCSSLEENNELYRKVSFEDVNKVKDDPSYLIIDVREPSELVEHGSIPGSINIPCKNFHYKHIEQMSNQRLIFICLINLKIMQ